MYLDPILPFLDRAKTMRQDKRMVDAGELYFPFKIPDQDMVNSYDLNRKAILSGVYLFYYVRPLGIMVMMDDRPELTYWMIQNRVKVRGKIITVDYGWIAPDIHVNGKLAFLRVGNAFESADIQTDELINMACSGLAMSLEEKKTVYMDLTESDVYEIDPEAESIAGGEVASDIDTGTYDYIATYLQAKSSKGMQVPLLKGPTGVAKSAIIKNFADTMTATDAEGQEVGFRLVDFRLAFCTRLNFSGLKEIISDKDEETGEENLYASSSPRMEIVESTDEFRVYLRQLRDIALKHLGDPNLADDKRKQLQRVLDNIQEKLKIPIIFFDEITRAPKDVRGAIMTLLSGKTFMTWHVTEAKIVAATNVLLDISKNKVEADYSNIPDPHLVDANIDKAFNARFVHIEVRPNDIFSRWTEWANMQKKPIMEVIDAQSGLSITKTKQSIHPAVRSYIFHPKNNDPLYTAYNYDQVVKKYNQAMSQPIVQPDDPNEPVQIPETDSILVTTAFPSFRSWTQVSDYLYTLDQLKGSPKKVSSDVIYGLIGEESGADFCKYITSGTIMAGKPAKYSAIETIIRSDIGYDIIPRYGVKSISAVSMPGKKFKGRDFKVSAFTPGGGELAYTRIEWDNPNASPPVGTAYTVTFECEEVRYVMKDHTQAEDRLGDFVEDGVLSGTPVLMTGQTSIGKTARVSQVADKLNYRIYDVNLAFKDRLEIMGTPTKVSTLDEEGKKGEIGKPSQFLKESIGMSDNLPLEFISAFNETTDINVKGGAIPPAFTEHVAEESFERAYNEVLQPDSKWQGIILFFDELNRAGHPAMLSAVFEAVSDHRFMGVTFDPKIVKVVAACNIGSQYMDAGELDPALVARFALFKKEKYEAEDLRSFVNYMKRREFDDRVIKFVDEFLTDDEAITMLSKVEKDPDNYQVCATSRAFSTLNNTLKTMLNHKNKLSIYGASPFSSPAWSSLKGDPNNEDLFRQVINAALNDLDRGWIGTTYPGVVTDDKKQPVDMSKLISKFITTANDYLRGADAAGRPMTPEIIPKVRDLVYRQMKQMKKCEDLAMLSRDTQFKQILGDEAGKEFLKYFNPRAADLLTVILNIEHLSDSTMFGQGKKYPDQAAIIQAYCTDQVNKHVKAAPGAAEFGITTNILEVINHPTAPRLGQFNIQQVIIGMVRAAQQKTADLSRKLVETLGMDANVEDFIVKAEKQGLDFSQEVLALGGFLLVEILPDGKRDYAEEWKKMK